MLSINRKLSRVERDKYPHSSSSDEQQNADAQGVTVEVYRLQERLRRMPLVPREDWLRKKRADLVDKLFVAARRDRCLSHVNPWAARDSTVPPFHY